MRKRIVTDVTQGGGAAVGAGPGRGHESDNSVALVTAGGISSR
jgi:hypothetical protein